MVEAALGLFCAAVYEEVEAVGGGFGAGIVGLGRGGRSWEGGGGHSWGKRRELSTDITELHRVKYRKRNG
jgi:hypothetical protein